MGLLKTYRWSFIITAAAIIIATIYSGAGAASMQEWLLAAARGLMLIVVLCVMEISLSFDNAVLNASILKKMNPFWQKMFLTVGIILAVFVMRLVFPIMIVVIATGLDPFSVWGLAMEKGDPHTPGTYGYILAEAHPIIAAFGGMFLLMLFLNFVFEDRDIKWLHWIERPLARVGQINMLSVAVALVALLAAIAPLADAEARFSTIVPGILGIILFVVIKGISSVFEELGEKFMNDAGKAGFFLFLYLELIDATLSFDGVIGAFAITADPVIIMLGLLAGAMFVRSMTVNLVRKGTLDELVHLEHGAHWAIGALAAILLVSITVHVNEFITGFIGLAFIGAAFWTSKRYQKREAAKSKAPAKKGKVAK